MRPTFALSWRLIVAAGRAVPLTRCNAARSVWFPAACSRVSTRRTISAWSNRFFQQTFRWSLSHLMAQGRCRVTACSRLFSGPDHNTVRAAILRGEQESRRMSRRDRVDGRETQLYREVARRCGPRAWLAPVVNSTGNLFEPSDFSSRVSDDSPAP